MAARIEALADKFGQEHLISLRVRRFFELGKHFEVRLLRMHRRQRTWSLFQQHQITGTLVSYPINWWLVVNHLKHGMMTVRPAPARKAVDSHAEQAMGQKMEGMSDTQMAKPSVGAIVGMAVLSIAMFAIGVGISAIVAGHH